ncbi:hypothetical protein [Marinimicrobium locisalis]|uniref:hypothetical protein n=1 Tax=Marinimicrobium locisalis TaxID=546022 RepID=UPI0032219B39
MKAKTTNTALLAVAVLVTPAVVFSIYDIFRVLEEASQKHETIILHSGTHYLLLGTVLWVLVVLQQMALKGREATIKKWGGKVLIGWFLSCLLLANVIPMALSSHLKEKGYHKCVVLDVTANHRRGREYIYALPQCAELNK